MILWTLCQLKDDGCWDLGGVFSTRERAVAACVHPDDCIWETELDHAYPRATVPVEAFFPLRVDT